MDTNIPTLVESVRDLIRTGSADELITLINDLHPADIVDILESLTDPERTAFFNTIPVEKAADIVQELEPDDQAEVIEFMGRSRSSQILREMDSDDAADLIGELSKEDQDELLDLMNSEGEDVRELLQYEEDSSGGIMATEFVAIRSDWTVENTLAELRHMAPQAETAYYLYVIDSAKRLVGVISLRDLVVANLTDSVGSVMNRNVVSIPVEADQEEAAQLFKKYRYLALPVVDDDGVLTGIITADDILDVVEEEATEDIQKIAGTVPLDKPYFATSLRELWKSRVVWLMVLFLAESITGGILQKFSDAMQSFIELTFFIPLLIDAGGNAGSQAAAIVIRGLAVRDIKIADFGRVLLRELTLGISLGIAVGGVAFLRAGRMGTGYAIPLIVSISVLAIIAMATAVGAILPILATVLKLDPATMSAPLITTVVDGLGLTLYFFIAKSILAF